MIIKAKKSRIDFPYILIPWKDTTYPQRTLSPAESSRRIIPSASSANSRIAGLLLQYHLISRG
jgi:hypothetical protein